MSNTSGNAIPKRGICILGSTGSIGKQALEVIDAHPDFFSVEVLTAQSSADLLIEQAAKYRPNAVVIGDEQLRGKVFNALDPLDIKVYSGANAIAAVTEMETVDVVLTAMVGFSGLKPTMRAIEAGKTIALANKETLVVAGALVMEAARMKGVPILPVDSEHSALFQCLEGEYYSSIEKLILTASGGPFRGKDRQFLETVTREQALKHPNWSMGAKITIDSATLMNKGLEVIEAHWLFGLGAKDIEVVVHPQSIIHSMVQFKDGSIKAQMGLPDMRLPIQYALAYPLRPSNNFPRFSFSQYPNLTFEAPDLKNFACLQLAFDVMDAGHDRPCVLNAANEIAVAAFLSNEIRFLQIPEMVNDTLAAIPITQNPNLSDLYNADLQAREWASERIKQYNKTVSTPLS